jgi:hypothetical protein
LSTDPENGINGDTKDLERRRKQFGTHAIQLPKVPGFLTFLSRQFEDPLVILLLWIATVVLGLSLFGEEA